MGFQRMRNVQKERSPKFSNIAKRGKWYYDDEENIMNFNKQLAALGLELRDIPGDGNCLFRALADQLNGHSRNHMKYRQQVVEYMRRNKDDFQPFVEDCEPYEDYLKRLSQPGTHAGNDAIVAFARRYRLIVVIHQLNSPMWQISGSPFGNPAEVHISYHNGVHYSSVRRIGDKSKAPACLTLSLGANQSNLGTNLISPNKSRGEPITKGTDFINCRYNEQNSCMGTIKNKSTSDDFKNSEMKEEVRSKSVTLWDPDGTGYRIFGDSLTEKTLYKTETEPLKSSFVNVEDTRECNDKQQNQSKHKEEKENSGSNRGKNHNRSEHSTILVKDLNCLNI